MCQKWLKPTETIWNLQKELQIKGNKKQAPVSLWHLQQVLESENEKRQNSTIPTCFHVCTKNKKHLKADSGWLGLLLWSASQRRHFWVLLGFWHLWNNVFISKLLNPPSKDKLARWAELIVNICSFPTFTGENCNWWFWDVRCQNINQDIKSVSTGCY